MGVSIPEGAKFERMVTAFEQMALSMNGNIDLTDFRQIQAIVQAGKASKYFDIGDQIVVKWNPAGDATEYDLPWDIVYFDNVTDPYGDSHPAMWLQSHYALLPVQFDGNEAFYVPTENMAAGTYYFTLGNNWGTHVVGGKSYQFTTTQAVPKGGQLVLGTATSNTSGLPDTAPANWRVRTFANGAQADPTEILALTEGTDGTYLGELSSSTKYSADGMNNMQRAAYGYNRWGQSAMRQYLNSAEASGAWWSQKNPFDHRPDQLASMRGFMAGLPADFLDVVRPVKVTTLLNTVSDVDIGTSEDTADTFFLPGLQQEYIAPQATGEGSPWQYWIDRLGTQHAQFTVRPEHIRYAIENHGSAQYVRLRSAHRGTAYYAWYVTSSGTALSTGSATYASRPAPACVIY